MKEVPDRVKSSTKKILGLVSAICCMSLLANTAWAIDWSAVQGTDITLFHPGQAAWEWILTQRDHSGAKKFKKNKQCRDCHEDEQSDIGALIVTGEKIEPSPIKGNVGSVVVNVKFARDASNLYVKFGWTAPPATGEKKMSDEHESMVTMMLGEANVKEAMKAGCWGTCHDDADDMPSHSGSEHMHKYLAKSRTKLSRHGGGTNYKSDDEINALLARGYFLEYWQARLNAGKPATGVDGIILKARHENDPVITSAESEFKDGAWSVVLTRPLQPGLPNHKDLVAGTVYHIGFALHTDSRIQRFHKVSFNYTLMLDEGDADFVAVSQ